MTCFIIAEAGVNHNGNPELALQLVDAAAAAGADAVKFQSFRTDKVVIRGTEKAAYQKTHTGDGDQYDMILALELDEIAHERIAERCVQRGIEFMSTPFDEWATDLLLRLGMRRIKIASGELTHRPFIEQLAKRGLPLILSTGMASMEEVRRSVDWLRACHTASDQPDWLTVLHCTSNYPTLPCDVNLRAMQSLASELGVPVGYSDHTLGIEVSLAAVALGATVIEKHFTLNRSLPGPDHQASLDPAQLGEMVRAIRAVESALGNGVKQPTASELPVRALVRRSAFVSRHLKAGSIGFDQLVFLGDLLTYGVEPEEVLEIAAREAASGAVFIKGNHEQLYFDLARGRQDYLLSLPEWLQETICWTQAKIGSIAIEAQFQWQNEWIHGPVLFAHANPFAFGDWTYLNGDLEILRAAIVLRERGAKLGVFGHTYRPKVVLVQESTTAHNLNAILLDCSSIVELPMSGVAIFDIGSVGQPRNVQKFSSAGIVTFAGDRISCECVSLEYDLLSHQQKLVGSSISENTIHKLLGFFQ